MSTLNFNASTCYGQMRFVSMDYPTTNTKPVDEIAYPADIRRCIIGYDCGIVGTYASPPPLWGYCRTWFNFSLSPITGSATINSAHLKLYSYANTLGGDYNNFDMECYTSTYNGAPANWNAQTGIEGDGVVTVNYYSAQVEYDFDVTSQVQSKVSNGWVTFVIMNADEANGYGGQFQGGTHSGNTYPVMEIDYTVGSTRRRLSVVFS